MSNMPLYALSMSISNTSAYTQRHVIGTVATICAVFVVFWWYNKRCETPSPMQKPRTKNQCERQERTSLEPTIKIHSLFLYPIKSCGQISVNTIRITKTGVKWDRKFCIIDDMISLVGRHQIEKLQYIQPIITTSNKMILTAPNMDDLQFDIPGPNSGTFSQRTKCLVKYDKSPTGLVIAHYLKEKEEIAKWLNEFTGEALNLCRIFGNHERAPMDRQQSNDSNESQFSDSNEGDDSELNTCLSNESPQICVVSVELLNLDQMRPNIVLEGGGYPSFEDDITDLGSEQSGVLLKYNTKSTPWGSDFYIVGEGTLSIDETICYTRK